MGSAQSLDKPQITFMFRCKINRVAYHLEFPITRIEGFLAGNILHIMSLDTVVVFLIG